MSKILLLLIFGIIAPYALLGHNKLEASQVYEEVLNRPVIHLAGKRLVKSTWSLGGTLSAKSSSFSDIDLLVADVENFDQRAFNIRLEGSYFVRENLSAGLGLQFGEDKADLTASLLNNSLGFN